MRGPSCCGTWRTDSVQEVLARRHQDHGEKGKKFFLLRGLLFCGVCGRRMTAEDHPGGSYYRCMPDARFKKCSAPLAPVHFLNEVVEAILPEVRLRPDHRARVEDALLAVEAERTMLRNKEENGLVARAVKLDGRLAKLTECLLDGTVPRDQFATMRTQYQGELDAVNRRLAFLRSDLTEDVKAVRVILDQASAVDRLYQLATTDAERKDVLRQVFAKIVVRDREIIKIEYNPPYHLLLGDAPEAGSGMQLNGALLEHLSRTK